MSYFDQQKSPGVKIGTQQAPCLVFFMYLRETLFRFYFACCDNARTSLDMDGTLDFDF